MRISICSYNDDGYQYKETDLEDAVINHSHKDLSPIEKLQKQFSSLLEMIHENKAINDRDIGAILSLSVVIHNTMDYDPY